MDTSWYRTFFSGIVLEMWFKTMPEEQTTREIEFVIGAIDARAGARVLDVPCGGGRHSVGLAMRGLKVTGVDLSTGMIEEGRRRAAAAGVSVEWVQADMRELPWREEFDAACCLGNSLGYIDPAATGEFLKAVAASLKPGGRMVIDTGMAAESVLPRLKEREWMQVDDILFLEENRYLTAESCIETVYTFVRDGRTESRTGLQWVFTLREIRSMLQAAGLVVRELHGAHDDSPYQLGSPLLVVVAEKTAI